MTFVLDRALRQQRSLRTNHVVGCHPSIPLFVHIVESLTMTEDTGSLADARTLADILEMHSAPLQNVISAFSQAFPTERHGVAVTFMRGVLDFAHRSACMLDFLPQTLTVYYLLRHIAAEATQGPRRGTVAGIVRAAQYHELQRLESLLRDDARISESLKYKQSAPTGPKKQSAKDASDLDNGRAHLLLKVALFRQLQGQAPPTSVADLFKIERAALEAEADGWSTPASKQTLVEAISELKAAADAENAAAMGGGMNRIISVHDEILTTNAPIVVDPPRTVTAPPVHRLPPTYLAPQAFELRFVCAPSAAVAFCPDVNTPSADWKTVTSLLAAARTQTLSAAQHQSLATAAQRCVVHCGLTIPAFLDISEKNPQTAAHLIQAIAQPEPYLDALIALPGAAGCQRTEVMLAARKALQPHQLSAYIKNMVNVIRSPGQQKSPAQQELVSNFAVTLHQLVGSPSALSKIDADAVVPLFTDFAPTVPDVPSLWSSLLK